MDKVEDIDLQAYKRQQRRAEALVLYSERATVAAVEAVPVEEEEVVAAVAHSNKISTHTV